MDNNFWMVYVEGRSASTYKHSTFESAQREAKRLANLSEIKGAKVYVLKAVGYAIVEDPCKWVDNDNLPF